MKGIILKDLYDNFYIKKNLASYIFGVGFILVTGLLVRTQYSFILFTELLASIIGSSCLEAATEQDEKSNFARLMMAFPLTKAQIIQAKYRLGLLFLLAANVLSLAYALVNVFVWRIVTLGQALPIWAMGISISVAFTSIVYIMYFLFGKKVGMIIYIILAVIIASSYGATASILGLDGFIAMDKTLILCVSLPCAFLLYGLSTFVSVHIYRWKTA